MSDRVIYCQTSKHIIIIILLIKEFVCHTGPIGMLHGTIGGNRSTTTGAYFNKYLEIPQLVV